MMPSEAGHLPGRWRAIRAWIAVVIVLTCSVIGNLRLLVKSWRDTDAPAERDSFRGSITKWERLRDVLPPGGVIGLQIESRGMATDHDATLYMAQYALAPLVVVSSKKPDWLVIESPHGNLAEELDASGRWNLVHRADGLSVYQRK